MMHTGILPKLSCTTYSLRVLATLQTTIDRLWLELAKFGVVGLVSFVIDLGGFNLLVAGPMAHKVTTAKLLSGGVATVVAWLGNRYWTFRHRRNRPVHHELALFFIVNAIALVVSAGWVALAHYAFHATGALALNFAAFVGIGLGTLFRFWTYRRFVFANEPEVAGTDAANRVDSGTSAQVATQETQVALEDRNNAKTAG